MSDIDGDRDFHFKSDANSAQSLWTSRIGTRKAQLSVLLMVTCLITAVLAFVFSLDPDYLQDKLPNYVPSTSKTSPTTDSGTNVVKSGDFKLFLGVLYDPVRPEAVQVASITAYDTMDGTWLEGVHVKGSISKGKQIILIFEGDTDTKGRTTYTWEIGRNVEPGLYILQAEGSHLDQSVHAEPLYFLVESAREN